MREDVIVHPAGMPMMGSGEPLPPPPPPITNNTLLPGSRPAVALFPQDDQDDVAYTDTSNAHSEKTTVRYMHTIQS